MSEKNSAIKNSFYGTKLSFWAVKSFLAATTFIAAYAASSYIIVSMIGRPSIVGATLFAILIVRFIDGTLDNTLDYLLEKDNPSTYKWVVAIVLSIATGGSTWFSASIIADMGTDYVDLSEQREYESEAKGRHDKVLAALSSDIETKQTEIDKLQQGYAADTSAVLQAMNSHHAKYWRNGRWRVYYNNLPKYQSLTASIDKILAIDTVYQRRHLGLSEQLTALNEAYVQTASKDVAGITLASVSEENEREANKHSTISIFIKCLDVIGIMFLWFIFLDIRKMIKDDNMSLDGSRVDFTRWAMDMLAKMKAKALTTDTKIDDALVDLLTGFVKIIAAFFRLISWASGLFGAAILFPTTIKGKKTTNYKAETSGHNVVLSPDYNTGATNQKPYSLPPRQTTDYRTTEPEFGDNHEVPATTTNELQTPTTPVRTGVAGDLSPTTTTINRKAPPVYSGQSKAPTTKKTTTTNSVQVVNYIGEQCVVHNGKKRSRDWIEKQIRDNKRRRDEYIAAGKTTTTQDYNISLFETYLDAIQKATA